jgi:hypothetical protein
MKLSIIALIIPCMIFGPFVLMGQEKCTDAIHQTDYRISILDCCIRAVKDGNVVVYSKNGALAETEAVAVNLNGRYYDLTNARDSSALSEILLKKYPTGKYNETYQYYKDLHGKAVTQVIFGSVAIAGGAGIAVAGFSIMHRNAEAWPEKEASGEGFFVTLFGMGLLGTGIALTAVGATKKNRYKRNMLEIEQKEKLSLELTPNGVGLVLRF